MGLGEWKRPENMDGTPEMNLALAIVCQAVEDYESVLRGKNPCGCSGCRISGRKIIKEECERFFRSRWFEGLCEIDGRVLMEKVRKRAESRKGSRATPI